MANNLRTFYACQAIAVAPLIPDSEGNYSGLQPTSNYKFIHGVQSVGLNSTIDFENVFELGQLEIYNSVLNIPEIEITVEKVLDGYSTIYGLLSSGTPLETASKRRANIRFALYGDEGNAGSSPAGATSGNLLGVVQCTGMYINNVSYTFPVDGNCTESITFVGNSKSWIATTNSGVAFDVPSSIANGEVLPNDLPAFSGAGVSRRLIARQDVIYTGPGYEKAQNVTLTLNLAREDVFEFGKRIPYAKIATYPIETSTEVESLAVSGSYDDVSFSEDTVANPDDGRTIQIHIDKTLFISMGNGNFLTSINHTGGDATGGNATVSRSYTGYNSFTITDSGTI